MKIGFIGLGAMGRPMASNLLSAGYEVHAFDVVEAAVKELEGKGAVGHGSASEMAGAVDVIICSLPNAKIVEGVMCGEKGVLDCCKQDAVIIDMSSVAPNSTREMAKKAAAKGVHYIDAPVSGGVSGAAAGTLTIMVGADDETFARVRPIFDVLGKNIYHVGEVGGGDAIKMVNNLLLGCNMAALAEALTLGVKCGLSVETMKQVISVSSGRSYALDAKLEKFIMAGQFAGGFAVDLQYKDLGLALEASRDERVPLPMTAAAAQVYEMARAKGQGREDMSSVVKVWEDLTGAKIHGETDDQKGA